MADEPGGGAVDWERSMELFDELHALPEPEWRSRLAELAAEDPELALDLEGLLEAWTRDPEFLQRSDETPGPEWHGFRILKRLGSGGRGSVYLAHQPSLDRQVALKVLSPGVRMSSLHRERFRREGRTAARLVHPGIVAVHEVGTHEDAPYLVMEHVRGSDLAKELAALAAGDGTSRLVRTAGRSYPQLVAEIVRDVARALEHAHRHGVVHRDIKPSNILLDEDLHPRIVDFGLALDELASRITRTGNTEGTPNYMSPEQVRADRSGVDHRTDVYSLGVVMYELLTRERPFEAPTSHQVLHDIVTRVPRSIRRLNPDVPRDLAVVCETAMQKAPRDRYATAGALADDLDRFLAHVSVVARRPPPWVAAGRFALRHRALVASAGAVVVLAWIGSEVRASYDRRVEERDLVARGGDLLARFQDVGRDELLAFREELRLFGAEDPASAVGRLDRELGVRFDERCRELDERAFGAVRDGLRPSLRTELERPPPTHGSLADGLRRSVEAALYHGAADPQLLQRLSRAFLATIRPRLRFQATPGPVRYAVQRIDPILFLRGPVVAEGTWDEGPLTVDPGWVQLTFRDGSGSLAEIVRHVPAGGDVLDVDLWLRDPAVVERDMVRVTGEPVTVRFNAYDETGSRDIEVPFEPDDLLVDRHALTNGEYQEFLSATQRAEPSWWGEDRPADFARRPVTNLSREEARTCAEFFGKRLPTLPEWTLVFRGEEGRAYPWGPEQGPRFAELGLGRPRFDPVGGEHVAAATWDWYVANILPVDEQPAWSATPQGVLGGVGSIAEMTSSLHFDRLGGVWRASPSSSWMGGIPCDTDPACLEEEGLGMRTWAQIGSGHPSRGFRCVRSGTAPREDS